jgi:hypothetical protein
MTDRPRHAGLPLEVSGWSNRILLLAVAGILFLTLYPFRFDFTSPEPASVAPLLLRGWGKGAGKLDVLLNILLFVPYGVAVALKLRGRGVGRAISATLVLAAGALLSYSVELLQFYIPQRDSGWLDVVTNSTGAAAGSLLFDLCGPAALRFLTACARSLEVFLTLARIVAIFVLYLAVCFAVSVPLEKAVDLSSWKPNSFLAIGNRVTARPPSAWIGEISQLELWDRALPADFARELTSGHSRDSAGPQPLAWYDFSGSPPFRDRQGFLSSLDWISNAPVSTGPRGLVFDRESRLISGAPIATLVDDVRTIKQFSLRVVCTPSQIVGMYGRIVSISDGSPLGDLELRQEEDHLVFWFRNSVLVKRPLVAWNHSEVFAAQQTRDILVSYDGSALSVYIDGKRLRGNYEFGPGSTLALLVGRAKANELTGYRYIYYAIIFCPAGCLLGLASRKLSLGPSSRILSMILGVALPSVLFEVLIVRLSGRPIHVGSLALSVVLTLAGTFWINSDGGGIAIRSAKPKLDGLVA